MTDSYEPPTGHRPWQAHHPDWAAPSQSQDHHPDWAAPSQNQDHLGQPAVPSAPAGWAAQDHYSNHSNGYVPGGGHLERRPPNWPAYDLPQPPVPGQPPYPAHTAPFWRQGWADYDPRSGSGYPVWPGHPAYTARNVGLRRLSKLTWRAAEVSAVIAVGFAALFAR